MSFCCWMTFELGCFHPFASVSMMEVLLIVKCLSDYRHTNPETAWNIQAKACSDLQQLEPAAPALMRMSSEYLAALIASLQVRALSMHQACGWLLQAANCS